jgi:hypothetical protein
MGQSEHEVGTGSISGDDQSDEQTEHPAPPDDVGVPQDVGGSEGEGDDDGGSS